MSYDADFNPEYTNLVQVKCPKCGCEFKVEEPFCYEKFFYVKCDCGHDFTYPEEDDQYD